MDRVIVTNPFVGVCHMQVCAAADATDEEILAACNHEVACGTTRGWCSVLRQDREFPGMTGGGPVNCSDHPGRVHFLVAC